MEDPTTNQATLPNVAPTLIPNPAPTPQMQPVAPNRRQSRRGFYSFIGGIVTAGGGIAIANTTFTVSNPNTLVEVLYGVVALLALACLFCFSVPSFKRTPYPNLLGMVGFLLCIVACYESLNALITLLALGVR